MPAAAEADKSSPAHAASTNICCAKQKQSVLWYTNNHNPQAIAKSPAHETTAVGMQAPHPEAGVVQSVTQGSHNSRHTYNTISHWLFAALRHTPSNRTKRGCSAPTLTCRPMALNQSWHWHQQTCACKRSANIDCSHTGTGGLVLWLQPVMVSQ